MICLNSLSKHYGTKTVLNEVSYHFPKGEKLALVGENGAGKSTLLNILCGLESPDEGSITKPSQCIMGYLPQEPNPAPLESILLECQSGHQILMKLQEQLEASSVAMAEDPTESLCIAYEEALTAFEKAGGYAWESNAKSILIGLGFSQQQLSRSPKELSGGWRMRLELGKLFLAAPDFLILDEPTNHLDLPSLVWVEEYLKTFPGTLLFVSHDRALLNRLSSLTLHLDGGRLTAYAGNYDQFCFTLEERLTQGEAAFGNIEKKKKQLEEFIDRYGAKASKASQAQSKQKQVDRLAASQGTIQRRRSSKQIHFTLPPPSPVERIICDIKQLSIGYGDTVLSSQLSLSIEKGQKIAVIGANGIGKSTLLKTLIGQIPTLEGSLSFAPRMVLSYFAQDQLDTLNPKESVLDNVLRLTSVGQKEARGILGGFLFSGEDVFKPVGVLSGGEKSRVGLAVSLAKKANFLILDEPTNHLDMQSVDMLGEAIKAYQGTVLFVSHDREFIDHLCSHVLAMTGDGRSMVFEGKLEDYQRLSALGGFPNVLSTDASGKTKEKTKKNQPQKKEEKKIDQNEEKKRQKIEATLAQIEDQLLKIEEAINQVMATDYDTLATLEEKRLKLLSEKETWEEVWLNLTH